MKMDLESGALNHREKAGTRSAIWDKFHEIYCTDTDQTMDFFVYCLKCTQIIMSPYTSGPTTKLLRHKATCESNKEMSSFSKADMGSFKTAAAKFVSYDMRPYYSIEGDGLKALLGTAYKLGQTNRNIPEENFLNAIPTRNTVRKTVSEIAEGTRKHISSMMEEAIRSGGMAITTDTWADNFRKSTYLALVAHLCIAKGKDLQFHRFVLSTNVINEMVKTGK